MAHQPWHPHNLSRHVYKPHTPMGIRMYRPMAFADAVLTHDVQDAHADGVSVPTASGQACQAHASKHPALRAASCAGLHNTRTMYGAASGKRKL